MHKATIEKLQAIEAEIRAIEPRTVHAAAAANAIAGAANMLREDELVREQNAKAKTEADTKRLEEARRITAEADAAAAKAAKTPKVEATVAKA